MLQSVQAALSAARSALLKFHMISMKDLVPAKRYMFPSRRLFLFAPCLIWKTAFHVKHVQKHVRAKRSTMIWSLLILILMLALSWEQWALRPMTPNHDMISDTGYMIMSLQRWSSSDFLTQQGPLAVM